MPIGLVNCSTLGYSAGSVLCSSMMKHIFMVKQVMIQTVIAQRIHHHYHLEHNFQHMF